MTTDALQKSLKDLIATYGVELLQRELRRLDPSDPVENVLTIVSNSGTHALPKEHLHGTVYFASEGSLDFSSGEEIKKQFEQILINLARVVKSKRWNKIYLLPFGPSALTMLIKLLVFRITYIDTWDIIYLGNGKYSEIQIETRDLIANL
jgi:hypothetical protein